MKHRSSRAIKAFSGKMLPIANITKYIRSIAHDQDMRAEVESPVKVRKMTLEEKKKYLIP